MTRAELQELTSPAFTISMAISGTAAGILAAAIVVLATVALDTPHLVGFAVAATAAASTLVWSTVEAAKAYRKRRALSRMLRHCDAEAT